LASLGVAKLTHFETGSVGGATSPEREQADVVKNIAAA
jgi:hypothetical protein